MEVDFQTVDMRRHCLDPPFRRHRRNGGDPRVVGLEQSHRFGTSVELARRQEQVNVRARPLPPTAIPPRLSSDSLDGGYVDTRRGETCNALLENSPDLDEMCLDIQIVLSQFPLQYVVGQILASPRPQQSRQAVLVGKFDNARVDRGAFYLAAGGKIEQ
jgi:hypothetical protein